MINNKTIAVVVPCFNEESQIEMVIENMPDFVDRIIVVNDNFSASYDFDRYEGIFSRKFHKLLRTYV